FPSSRPHRVPRSFPTRRSSDLDAQLAGQPMLERLDLFAHGARVTDDPARPVEGALAFRGETDEARAALHQEDAERLLELLDTGRDRKSTRLNSSHEWISYAVFC